MPLGTEGPESRRAVPARGPSVQRQGEEDADGGTRERHEANLRSRRHFAAITARATVWSRQEPGPRESQQQGPCHPRNGLSEGQSHLPLLPSPPTGLGLDPRRPSRGRKAT